MTLKLSSQGHSLAGVLVERQASRDPKSLRGVWAVLSLWPGDCQSGSWNLPVLSDYCLTWWQYKQAFQTPHEMLNSSVCSSLKGVQVDHSYCLFSMWYSEVHIFKRLKICDRQSLDCDGLAVNPGDSSTPARHFGLMTDFMAKWCHLCDDKLITPLPQPCFGDQQQVEWFLRDEVMDVNRLGAGRLHIEEAYDQVWWGLPQFFPWIWGQRCILLRGDVDGVKSRFTNRSWTAGQAWSSVSADSNLE